MLLSEEIKKLDRIQADLDTYGVQLREGGASLFEANRRYFDALRRGLHLYEDVVRRYRREGKEPGGDDYGRLYKIAGTAIREIGGQAEPASISLEYYDHDRYGPFLGVSDDGSAADHIRKAALGTPKMRVIGEAEPIVVGVSHDAERLGAVGEVVVGPGEYEKIRLGCIGRILTSTNVGTRVNVRYYKQHPVIDIQPGPAAESLEIAAQKAASIIEPFIHTPDGVPRPLTVLVRFAPAMRRAKKVEILKKLSAAFSKGTFCKPGYHKLGLLDCVGRGKNGVIRTMDAIDMAKEADLSEVAIKGTVTRDAEDKISMPGLLEYFSPNHAAELLEYTSRQEIILTPWNIVDPDTVARSVWTGLQCAKNMGLHLGKYGLFPLTLPESDVIMKLITGWFPDWSAAPAFYIDLPTLDSTAVYTESNIVSGAKEWLKIVARHKIPVVLIDTADKGKGRKLLKKSPQDKVGILDHSQIADVDSFAKNLGIKALWAGGLDMAQAYELGKLGVFGIYVTTSASVARVVSGEYKYDGMLASVKEPTFEGVYRVKLLLESGFLASRLNAVGLRDKAGKIDDTAQRLIEVAAGRKQASEELKHVQGELDTLAEEAWKIHFEK